MQRKQNKNSWTGIIVFLLLMFGSPITRFIASLIYQVTGTQVDPSMILVGLIILSVIVSLLVPMLGNIGGGSRSNETRLPTGPMSMPPPPSPPQSTLPPPTPPQISANPRFDPVIDPRILIFGVIGLVFFGVIFLFILSMTGVI